MSEVLKIKDFKPPEVDQIYLDDLWASPQQAKRAKRQRAGAATTQQDNQHHNTSTKSFPSRTSASAGRRGCGLKWSQ